MAALHEVSGFRPGDEGTSRDSEPGVRPSVYGRDTFVDRADEAARVSTRFLGTPVTVAFDRVEDLPLGDHILTVPALDVVHELQVLPEGSIAYACVSSEVVGATVAALLDLPWWPSAGGQGPTQIEQAVFERLSARLLPLLVGVGPAEDGRAVRIMSTTVGASGQTPADPAAPVVVARFRLTIADQAEGRLAIWWCAPSSAINLSDSPPGASGVEKVPVERRCPSSAMERQVALLPVTITAVFGPVSVPRGQVTGLQPGQVLLLGARTEAPVAVQVEGVTKLWARPGDPRGGHAIRIVERKDIR